MLEQRLQKMLDHYEIVQLMGEFSHAFDRLDEAQMAAVYAPDSWDDHGNDKCSGAEFARRTAQLHRTYSETMSHQLGQTLTKIEGDKAGAETYFIVSLRRRTRNGTQLIEQLGGRYVDELRRIDGAWRIQSRICIREWSITHKVVKDWVSGSDFVEGRRDADDPACRLVFGCSAPGNE